MDTTIEFFTLTRDSKKEQLEDYRKSCISFGIKSLIVGIILALFAAVVAICSIFGYLYYCVGNINYFCLSSVLCGIGTVICFGVYKTNVKQADYYTQELIVLRDLEIAINICGRTSEEDFEETLTEIRKPEISTTVVKSKSQRSKIEEQIIQTLLQRCLK